MAEKRKWWEGWDQTSLRVHWDGAYAKAPCRESDCSWRYPTLSDRGDPLKSRYNICPASSYRDFLDRMIEGKE